MFRVLNIFDQIKLQLRKPEGLNFKSHKPSSDTIGSGEGEMIAASKQKIVVKMLLQDTVLLSAGRRRIGSHESGMHPDASSSLDVPKGSPNAMGSSH